MSRPLLLRRLAQTITAGALRLRGQTELRPPPGCRVLAIAPHPDDLELGCAGTLRAWAMAGLAIDVVVITDGGATSWSRDAQDAAALRSTRRAEALAGMRALGLVAEHSRFLDVPDGTLASLSPSERSNVCRLLAQILTDLSPTMVLLPSGRDLSSEHDAVNAIFREAHQRCGSSARILEFPVWSWWNPMPSLRRAFTAGRIWRSCVISHLAAKRTAIECHRTQVGPTHDGSAPPLSPEFVQSFLRRDEYFFEC